MKTTLTILAAVGTVGAIDVLYYHLYRFRLYSQPGCVAEEVTHLLRNAIFIAILLVCMQPSSPGWARVMFFLIAADLANSVVDVLLERRSRESLGGLPSGEYLVHVLSSFGTGLAVASYTMSLGSPAPVLDGPLWWQIHAMVAMGVVLLAIEGVLFARAIAARGGAGARTLGTAAATR
jgi:hypothetical protein